MSAVPFQREFEAKGDELPGGEKLGALRRAAFDRFGELGLPGRRIETWRYTDLTSFADRKFRFAPPPPDADRLAIAAARLDDYPPLASGSRAVFVDGCAAASLSDIDPDAGIEILPPRLGSAGDFDDSALAALNAAFLTDGAEIRIDGRPEAPIELVFVGTGQHLAPQLRLSIDLAAEAEATVIISFIDADAACESWLNLVSELSLGDASSLTLYRLQAHGDAQNHTALHRARLSQKAKLTAGNVELGGKLVRNEFEIALDGPEAEARVFGLAVARDAQHCDTRIAVDHRAERTLSRQDYRAIVADTSRSVFNGKVVVRETAQHIDARQRNDNLLLSSKAEVDTKPELEIYADQVICSHGATIGELDEAQLFYLRARGIDAETARAMLTAGFADTILRRIEHNELYDRARLAVDARLPRTPGTP